MTTATMPDCASLFQGVLDAPRAAMPKLVLADWLDDQGEPGLAHGFRWCGGWGRHPAFSAGGRFPGWRKLSRTESGRGLRHFAPEYLPLTVAGLVGCTKQHQKVSWRGPRAAAAWAAFAAVAAALESLAAVYRLPPEESR